MAYKFVFLVICIVKLFVMCINNSNVLVLDVELCDVVNNIYMKGKAPTWVYVLVVKPSSLNNRLNHGCTGRFTKNLNDIYFTNKVT